MQPTSSRCRRNVPAAADTAGLTHSPVHQCTAPDVCSRLTHSPVHQCTAPNVCSRLTHSPVHQCTAPNVCSRLTHSPVHQCTAPNVCSRLTHSPVHQCTAPNICSRLTHSPVHQCTASNVCSSCCIFQAPPRVWCGPKPSNSQTGLQSGGFGKQKNMTTRFGHQCLALVALSVQADLGQVKRRVRSYFCSCRLV